MRWGVLDTLSFFFLWQPLTQTDNLFFFARTTLFILGNVNVYRGPRGPLPSHHFFIGNLAYFFWIWIKACFSIF